MIQHAKAAFGMAGAIQPNTDAKKVFEWLKEEGFKIFSKTDLHNRFKSWNKERLDGALCELVGRNIVKEGRVITPGRTATEYISNPALIGMVANP